MCNCKSKYFFDDTERSELSYKMRAKAADLMTEWTTHGTFTADGTAACRVVLVVAIAADDLICQQE